MVFAGITGRIFVLENTLHMVGACITNPLGKGWKRNSTMEIILGVIFLYVIYLLIQNIEMVLLVVFVVFAIWGVYTLIKLYKENQPKEKCISGHCEHCNVAKAKEAGLDSSHCYCKYKKEYTELRKECEHYQPRGCASSMCDYADFTKAKDEDYGNEYCYCKYFDRFVKAKESCEAYSDDEVKAIFQSLSKS